MDNNTSPSWTTTPLDSNTLFSEDITTVLHRSTSLNQVDSDSTQQFCSQEVTVNCQIHIVHIVQFVCNTHNASWFPQSDNPTEDRSLFPAPDRSPTKTAWSQPSSSDACLSNLPRKNLSCISFWAELAVTHLLVDQGWRTGISFICICGILNEPAVPELEKDNPCIFWFHSQSAISDNMTEKNCPKHWYQQSAMPYLQINVHRRFVPQSISD